MEQIVAKKVKLTQVSGYPKTISRKQYFENKTKTLRGENKSGD